MDFNNRRGFPETKIMEEETTGCNNPAQAFRKTERAGVMYDEGQGFDPFAGANTSLEEWVRNHGGYMDEEFYRNTPTALNSSMISKLVATPFGQGANVGFVPPEDHPYFRMQTPLAVGGGLPPPGTNTPGPGANSGICFIPVLINPPSTPGHQFYAYPPPIVLPPNTSGGGPNNGPNNYPFTTSQIQNVSTPMNMPTHIHPPPPATNLPPPQTFTDYIYSSLPPDQQLQHVVLAPPGHPMMSYNDRLERQHKIERYKAKKRNWLRKVNYSCRQTQAKGRLRIKGRFISRENEEHLINKYDFTQKKTIDPESITSTDLLKIGDSRRRRLKIYEQAKEHQLFSLNDENMLLKLKIRLCKRQKPFKIGYPNNQGELSVLPKNE